MLEGQGSPKISLTSTITTQDLGFGLILTDSKRLYWIFISAVLGIAFFSLVAILKIDAAYTSPTSTILFFLVSVAAAFYLYSEAVMCLDTATITVTREKIEVIRRPIPPLKDLVIDTGRISQVFHERKVVGRRKRGSFSDSSRESPFYERYILGVITTDGKRVDLLRDLASEGDAKALEKEIERWLGIVERPVEDELRTIFVASGLWSRLTHSSSTNTFSRSPLFYLILGGVSVEIATGILVSGKAARGWHGTTMVSFTDDPMNFTLSVLVFVAVAGFSFYQSVKTFANAS